MGSTQSTWGSWLCPDRAQPQLRLVWTCFSHPATVVLHHLRSWKMRWSLLAWSLQALKLWMSRPWTTLLLCRAKSREPTDTPMHSWWVEKSSVERGPEAHFLRGALVHFFCVVCVCVCMFYVSV